MDIEETTLLSLIQHAQLMRAIRQSSSSEDGILCHYINIRHWAETTTPQTRLSKDRVVELCSKAYVQLLQNECFFPDPDRVNVFNQVIDVFKSYLEKTEGQLNDPQSGAMAGLEALHVFAIGVILASHPHTQPLGDHQQDTTTHIMLSQIQTALTLLSTRYSVVRTYRNIVSELQRGAGLPGSVDKLRSLVIASDLAIPVRLQRLILGTASGIGG